MYTTIQITAEEDQEILWLKKQLKLASKRAVVLAGIESLRQMLRNRVRATRLRAASQLVRKESRAVNTEWAEWSTATRDE